MSEQELKETICKTMHQLYNQGILTDLGGNISGRLPESEEIWISPSGIKKDTVTPDMLVKIDLEGNILEAPNSELRPSIESRIHTTIYEDDEDYCAIIHSHAPYAQAYSIVGPFDIPPFSQELSIIIPELPFVPFHRSGSEELANAIVEVIDTCGVAIMQNHGLITVGESMEFAVILTNAVEELLKVYLLAKQLGDGRPIITLPD